MSSKLIKSAHEKPFTKLMSINTSKSLWTQNEPAEKCAARYSITCDLNDKLNHVKRHQKGSFDKTTTFLQRQPEDFESHFTHTNGISFANFYYCVWLIYTASIRCLSLINFHIDSRQHKHKHTFSLAHILTDELHQFHQPRKWRNEEISN